MAPSLPLLLSSATVDAFLDALHPTSAAEVMEIRRLLDLGLPPATSITTLAVNFGYSPRFIAAIRKFPHRYYREFVIASGRKARTIRAPRIALKVVQRWVGHHLSRQSILTSAVHGFVPGRSTFSAAHEHRYSHSMFSLDIMDFFGSVTPARVDAVLSSVGYGVHARRVLNPLLCCAGSLPQGSPASPALANLSFHGTDCKLIDLATLFGAKYTRYADDLVFSAAGTLPAEFGDRVASLVEGDGWRIAKGKTEWQCRPDILRIHGLTIGEDCRLKLSRKYRNELRMMRYLLGKAVVSQDAVSRFRGHLAYADSLELFESKFGPQARNG